MLDKKQTFEEIIRTMGGFIGWSDRQRCMAMMIHFAITRLYPDGNHPFASWTEKGFSTLGYRTDKNGVIKVGPMELENKILVRMLEGEEARSHECFSFEMSLSVVEHTGAVLPPYQYETNSLAMVGAYREVASQLLTALDREFQDWKFNF